MVTFRHKHQFTMHYSWSELHAMYPLLVRTFLIYCIYRVTITKDIIL
jgi:hypothetical protein